MLAGSLDATGVARGGYVVGNAGTGCVVMVRVSTFGLDWLARARRDGGGVLTSDIPGAPWALQEWLGQRLIWWPRGVPPGERVGIVSSRLGSLGKLGRHWFAVLRQLCCDLDAERQVLVTAQGTSLDELLGRCARLFHIPLVRFEVPRPGCSAARWSADCRARSGTRLGDDAAVWPAVVSPPLQELVSCPVPARDAIVVAASDRVVACRVRRGGNIRQLLERRLDAACCASDARVDLIVGSGFVARHVAHELAARGATLRMADAVCRPGSVPAVPGGPVAVEGRGPAGPAAAGAAQPRILTVDQIPLTDYLTHCTRASEGPWPDQDSDEYLDHLILDRPDAVHSALSTLARIVTQRRLLASGRAIRGGTPVVCFTAVGVAELQRLRTYRAHRRRWDFEPYGISVARDWLQRRGCRPVTYGDEALWRRLPADQRPYFQRDRAGQRRTIDWSVEREWRHIGNVELDGLPPDAGFVFVPSRREAECLTGLCCWPLVVLS